MEEPARDAGYTVVFGGALLMVAGLMITSGVGRIRKTVWVIEHGLAAIAEVVEVRERTEWLMRGPRGVFTTQVVASCTFGFARSDRRGFDVSIVRDAVRPGDRLDIWYDPGMPANVLAIDAIPRAVLAGIA